MKREDIRVLIVRAPGTNCDFETAVAFQELGVKAEIIPFTRLVERKVRLSDYDIFVIPGGFSYGDYIRAGAVLGKKLMTRLGDEVRDFVKSGRPVIGICNGFQVLVEAGLIPGDPELRVALTTNTSMHYECRWTVLRKVNKSRCVLLGGIPEGALLRIPVGHGEGRLVVENEHVLKKLIEEDLVVFRYCKPDGSFADGEYPWNPNGSVYDIAALCSLEGNVLGMMPHPERAFFRWQLPDWTREREKVYTEPYADGYLVFKSIVEYVEKKF